MHGKGVPNFGRDVALLISGFLMTALGDGVAAPDFPLLVLATLLAGLLATTLVAVALATLLAPASIMPSMSSLTDESA
jgi:peptidoglycan/LPS O-acetylase OafA/YrhL